MEIPAPGKRKKRKKGKKDSPLECSCGGDGDLIDDGVHVRGVDGELDKVETIVYERERERDSLEEETRR